MAGLALVVWGFALLLTWLYARITTAPVVETRDPS
jgi:hypothetical protein